MKKPLFRHCFPLLGSLLLLAACQKSNSVPEDPALPSTGFVPDNPERIAAIPTIVSSAYAAALNAAPLQSKGPSRTKDADRDGIPDSRDACPSQAETINGYLDGDGCPDTTPAPEPLPATPLPTSYHLVMPPVQHQGGEGSCAAFATVYAARSAEYYYRSGANSYGYATNIFSPEFVYNQTKIDCGSGTGLTTALDFMMTNGVCTWQSMPYSSYNGCALQPTTQQATEALQYRISGYSKLITSDVTAMKTMIAKNHPVIITVNPDQAFWNAGPGFTWSSYISTPGISHILVISGYDDARQAYRVMNSWGTGWGDGGYAWISYSFLPQASFYYSYVIN